MKLYKVKFILKDSIYTEKICCKNKVGLLAQCYSIKHILSIQWKCKPGEIEHNLELINNKYIPEL